MADIGNLEYTVDLDEKALEKKIADTTAKLQAANKAWSELTNLNIGVEGIRNLDNTTQGVNSVSNAASGLKAELNALSVEWDKLTAEQRNSDLGMRVINDFNDKIREANGLAGSLKQTFDSMVKSGLAESKRAELEYQKEITRIAKEEESIRNKMAKQALRDNAKAEKELIDANKKLIAEKEKLAARERIEQAARDERLRVMNAEANSIDIIRKKIQILTESQNKSKFGSYQFKYAQNEIQKLNDVLNKHTSVVHKSEQKAKSFGETISTTSQKTNLFTRELKNALSIFGGFYFLRDFTKQLAEVSGQFELQRVSLRAITQDYQAADKIFGQLQMLAVKSPYQFMDLAAGAKQLAAMQVPVKELYETTKVITDLSAGLGVDMNRIILAYGQVQAASVLRGQELRQFTEAGIPLVQLLADKFSILENRVVSTSEVFDLISRRMVPFEMIKEIFTDLTSEGGSFFNMQEKQAQTLYGKISNLKDAYQIMLDEMGKANKGLLTTAVDIPRWFMENWKGVADVLTPIIVGYGSLVAVQKINLLLTNLSKKALLEQQAAKIADVASTNMQSIAYAKLNSVAAKCVSVFGNLGRSFKNLMLILKANWLILAISGVAALITHFVKLNNEVKAAKEEAMKFAIEIEQKRKKLNELTKALKDNIEAQNAANSIKSSAEREKAIEKAQNERLDTLKKLTVADKEYGTMMRKAGSDTDAVLAIQKEMNAELERQIVLKNVLAESKGIFSSGYEAKTLKAAEATQKVTEAEIIMRNELARNEVIIKKYIAAGGEYADKLNDILTSDKTDKERANLYEQVNASLGVFKKIDGLKFDRLYDFNKAIVNMQVQSVQAKNAFQSLLEETGFADRAKTIDFTPTIVDNKKVWSEEALQYADDFVSAIEASGANEQVKDYWKDIFKQTFDIEFRIIPPKADEFTGWQKRMSEMMPSAFGKQDVLNTTSLANAFDATRTKLKELTDTRREYGQLTQEQRAEANIDLAETDKQIQETTAYLNYYNQALSDSNKTGDARAESLKAQIDLMKEAYEMQEKLTKAQGSGQTKEDISKVGEGRYAGLVIPEDMDAYYDWLKEQYAEALQLTSDEGRKLAETLSKELANLDSKRLIDALNTSLKEAEKSLAAYKSDYDFYEKVLGITGDEQIAIEMAFGGDFGGSVIDQMKEQFSTLSGLEFTLDMDLSQMSEAAQKLYEDIVKAEDDASMRSKDNLLNILKDYSDFEDKKKAITAKAAKARADIEKEYAGSSMYAQLMSAVDNMEQKELSKVSFEMFKNSSLWAKTFEDIQRLATPTIDALIAKLEEMQSTTQDPTQLKEITNQLEKLKEAKIDRNPFESIADGITELGEAHKKLSALQESGTATEEELMDASDNLRSAQFKLNQAFKASMNVLQDYTDIAKDGVEILGNLGVDVPEQIGYAIEGLSKAFNSLAEIDITKPLSVVKGVVGAIAGVTGAIFNTVAHRNKKILENTSAMIKKMQGEYESIAKVIDRTLGAEIDKLYRKQRKLMEEQMKQYEAQLKTEGKKGGLSRDEADEIRQTLAELRSDIAYFAEDVANELYGIDLKSWADTLSGTIVDAFANGEDAVAAFDKSVADMMKSVVQQMISIGVIQPAMDKLRKYLFGADGKGGAFGSDMNLSKEEAAGMGQYLQDLKNGIGASKDLFDAINESLGGMLTSAEEAAGAGTAEAIKGVTEDTSQLIAGYMNGIRGEVIIHTSILKSSNTALNLGNTIAQSQLQTMTAHLAETRAIRNALESVITYDGGAARIRV